MKFQDLIFTLGIAIIWVLLYYGNHTLFRFTEVTSITNLIFIPSGYKIIVATVFRWRGWVGLFIGSLMTGYLFLDTFSSIDIVVFSFLSATLPLLALKLTEYCIPLKHDLSNLDIKHILLLGFSYGTMNGLFHISYRYHVLFLRDAYKIHEIFSMMVGDVLGILITMLIIARLTKLDMVQNFLKNRGG